MPRNHSDSDYDMDSQGRAPNAGRQYEVVESLSLVRFLSLLLRHRRSLLVSTLTVVLAAVVGTMILPRTYTLHASFTPQTTDPGATAGFSGIAAQFGVTIPAARPSESPAFYADLLRSRQLLTDAIDGPYSVITTRGFLWFADSVAVGGTLVQALEIEGGSSAKRIERALGWLRDATSIEIDHETGVVSISITSRWPELAEQLATRLLELVSSFNLDRRQSQAAAERRFIEERLEEAQKEVRHAEDRFAAFLERNRDFRNSPELLFQHDRLERDLSLRQQVLVSLTQAYERARIEEVRNTPVLTIIDPPGVPGLPDRRHLLIKGLGALLIGFLLGAGIALWREYMMHSRRIEPGAFNEYEVLKRETVAGVKRLVSVSGSKRQAD